MQHYDIFVSHCSKDKVKYVDNLVKEIKKLGLTVFYDSDSISWGDNIKDKIDEALKTCSLGLIVISKSFFDRKWTNYELNQLLLRQSSSNQKIILPLLYKITKKQFVDNYPELENIKFVHSKQASVEEIAKKLRIELQKAEKMREINHDY